MRNKTLISVLLLVLFSGAYAQTSKISQQPRVALYNSAAFDDPKTGIEKLAHAYYLMGFYDCFADTHTCNKGYERQKKMLIDPVLSEIYIAIKQLGAKNNMIMLDGAELEEKGYMLAFDEKTNVTSQFVRFFSMKQKHPNPKLRVIVPETKIGTINTKSLFDKSLSQKVIGSKPEISSLNQYCTDPKRCDSLFKAFSSYAMSKGFTLILDSSKDLPKELERMPREDITNDFISTFNRDNQINP